MKKIIVDTFICLMLVLVVYAFACAETKTYMVSVTIPAIPGVNAPPLEEAEAKASTPEQQTQAAEESKTNEGMAEQEGEVYIAQSIGGVNTVYVR